MRALRPAETLPSTNGSVLTTPSGLTAAPPDQDGAAKPRGHGRGEIAAPRVQDLFRRGARLTVSVRNRPRGARIDAVVAERTQSEFGYRTIARATRGTDRLTMYLRGSRLRKLRLQLRYVRARQVSRTVYRRVPR